MVVLRCLLSMNRAELSVIKRSMSPGSKLNKVSQHLVPKFLKLCENLRCAENNVSFNVVLKALGFTAAFYQKISLAKTIKLLFLLFNGFMLS